VRFKPEKFGAVHGTLFLEKSDFYIIKNTDFVDICVLFGFIVMPGKIIVDAVTTEALSTLPIHWLLVPHIPVGGVNYILRQSTGAKNGSGGKEAQTTNICISHVFYLGSFQGFIFL
jgi:hypothetical protein